MIGPRGRYSLANGGDGVGAAVLQPGGWIEPLWSSSWERWFAFRFLAIDYNDTLVYALYPDVIISESMGCRVRVTGITIGHVGTIGVVLSPYIETSETGDACAIRLSTFVTTLATEYRSYNMLDIPIKRERMTTVNALCGVVPTGYAPTDDMIITATGYISREPQISYVQPVSVEGFRWPLARRL